MSAGFWLPTGVVLSSLVPGVLIFFVREENHRARTALNLAGAVVKLALMGAMLWGVYHGRGYQARLAFVPGADLLLSADPLSLLFATLSAVLWLVTTIYAIAYLEDRPHRSRFFGFFSLCVSATMGISLAGNLVTFVVFYEMLTLVTYPLVVHRGDAGSLRAGRIYLAYTLAGGAVLLVGAAWLHALAGPLEFADRGTLVGLLRDRPRALTAIFGLLVAGLGVKAAIVPLHGWLPSAMVAPAPVSALLHAVAVVKAGAFGIQRVVYDVYGIDLCAQLGLTRPLAGFAAITILYGSVRAMFEDDLKRRLAFSTVSQVSYIVLGTALVGASATIGGLVHLVHQGIMKITLFFCAGNIAETLHLHRVRELDGIGLRLPWTMAAFTTAALGMIGVPPLAGFVTKWYLGLGAAEIGEPWVLVVLGASSVLNAAYFLPIVGRAWFGRPPRGWVTLRPRRRFETDAGLLLPTLFTALLVIAVGVWASAVFSPLTWARLIARREYGLP